jgi:hypothetical protein
VPPNPGSYSDGEMEKALRATRVSGPDPGLIAEADRRGWPRKHTATLMAVDPPEALDRYRLNR